MIWFTSVPSFFRFLISFCSCFRSGGLVGCIAVTSLDFFAGEGGFFSVWPSPRPFSLIFLLCCVALRSLRCAVIDSRVSCSFLIGAFSAVQGGGFTTDRLEDRLDGQKGTITSSCGVCVCGRYHCSVLLERMGLLCVWFYSVDCCCCCLGCLWSRRSAGGLGGVAGAVYIRT